jgi:N-methylhydantoinase B
MVVTIARKRDLHPVTLAVVAGALESITRDMSLVMLRTARSIIFKSCKDFSNTIFDSSARIVAQGEDELPLHLGSMIAAMRSIMKFFGDDIYPGDLIYHNDPETGGAHMMDTSVFRPIFYRDELLFWSGNKAHLTDIGGSVAGGYNPIAEDLYAEGLRVPPLKIHERGKERRDVINLIMANIRYTHLQLGDLKAQMATAAFAEKRLIQLLDKYGKQTIKDCVDELNDITEQKMRALIASWPDGTYEGENWVEEGRKTEEFKIKAIITVSGDQLKVELCSPPQVKAYINSYFGNSIAAAYSAVISFTGFQHPFNSGLYQPITIDCGPKGTVTNPTIPAPTSASTTTVGQNIMDAVRDAMCKLVPPGRRHAGWQHSTTTTSWGIDPTTNQTYAYLHLIGMTGGGGAAAGRDGWPGLGTEASAGGAIRGDIEDAEIENPILIRRSLMRTDSGCAGKWRGGLGQTYEFQPVDHVCMIGAGGEGEKFLSISIDGAESKLIDLKLASRYISDGETKRRVPRNSLVEMNENQSLILHSAGGGAIGDPFERDPEMVLRDVIDEKVSLEGAREEYGVAIDPETLQIDVEDTIRLRKEVR